MDGLVAAVDQPGGRGHAVDAHEVEVGARAGDLDRGARLMALQVAAREPLATAAGTNGDDRRAQTPQPDVGPRTTPPHEHRAPRPHREVLGEQLAVRAQ